MRWKFLFFILVLCCFFTGAFIHNGGAFLKGRKVPVTQMTENEDFLDFCREATANPTIFQNFKRSPIYNLFHENRTYEEGKECLLVIKNRAPELLNKNLLERIRTLDYFGDPVVHDYGDVGPFSATTLFYLKIAADIKRRFNPFRNLRVIQIGGESGGLCKVLHDIFDIEQYIIIDLPESLELAKKHLNALGVHHVQFCRCDEVKLEPCDFLISYNGFTESSAPLQKRYIKKLFEGASRGYLVCNFYPKQFQVQSMKREDLLKKIRKKQNKIVLYPEEPRTGRENFIVTWGT